MCVCIYIYIYIYMDIYIYIYDVFIWGTRRSLNVFPTEKQLQRWINEIEEEEPTGFIVYEKFETLAVRLLTVCLLVYVCLKERVCVYVYVCCCVCMCMCVV